MPAALSLQSVTKRYLRFSQSFEVLKGINLDVDPGEWITITGRSGSGKSTLIRAIGALDRIDRGDIYCFGESIVRMGPFKRARFRHSRIGFIFQSYQLLPDLTALENVILAKRLRSYQSKESKTYAQELLIRLRLEERFDHRPAELSGGEQQRVAIARALINRPDIILADEPTGNLDGGNSIEIMKLLQQLHKRENKTIIMVTHDSQLTEYSDKVYSLEKGLLCLLR